MDDMMDLITPADNEKLEKIYSLYRDTMLYVANGILRNEYLAEDAVQEAFLRIANNLHKISVANSAATKAFVSVITRNVALTMLNDMNKQIFVDNIDPLSYTESSKTDSILNQLEYAEVVASIKKISPTNREVVELYYVQGYKTKEISDRLGLSVETVKKRIQRGKRELLEYLPWGNDKTKK